MEWRARTIFPVVRSSESRRGRGITGLSRWRVRKGYRNVRTLLLEAFSFEEQLKSESPGGPFVLFISVEKAAVTIHMIVY